MGALDAPGSLQQLSLMDFDGYWTSDCGLMTISDGKVFDESGQIAPLVLVEGSPPTLELRFAGEVSHFVLRPYADCMGWRWWHMVAEPF